MNERPPELDGFDVVIRDGRILKAPDSLSIAVLPPTDQAPEAEGWEWALVEIFGHRRYAARVREEERFGAKLMRIDVPIKGDPALNGWETHYYGGASIFSYTPSDEQSVMRFNKRLDRPAPYRLAGPDDDDATEAPY